MFEKLKKIAKQKVHKLKAIVKTSIDKLLGHSNVSRWKQPKALFHDWDERTQLLADQIPTNSSVFEFGAARLSLRAMLPSGCRYLHSDLVSRAHDTYVLDLNKELPDIPTVDVIVFSGVLEYLFKVQELMYHLKDRTKIIVFSYATTNTYKNPAERRRHGWVSDHSLEFFEEHAKICSFEQQVIGTWRQQHLIKWVKKN